MKKFGIQLAILLIIIFGALYFSFNQGMLSGIMPQSAVSGQSKIKINNTVVNIEVADTPAERSQGLGGRDKIATDAGMLFIFPEAGKYQFWMKGMKFPLDFIFIRDGKIVDLLSQIPPPSAEVPGSTLPVYEPTVPVDMLLEVNGGFAGANGIKMGDQVFLVQ